MSKVIFREIPIKEICPNPHNPRKSFAGPKFQELVESIKQKGIIEPIIVRPIHIQLGGNKAQYEIVAGERRFKAAQALNLEKVPAIVRDLTDDEAFDFMIIENLQREDLTEREEAESFKAYLAKHSEAGAVLLGERTGIRPQYIRRRVAVLDLPAKILEAWDKGRLAYGFLEQLLRIQEKDILDQFAGRVLAHDYRRFGTISELKTAIDEMAPKFKAAFFDITGCAVCGNNTQVQKNLFDFDGGAHSCLNPKCFTEKQGAWLTENWKRTKYHAQHGTNGFRFSDQIKHSSYQEFYDWSQPKPGKKCLACPNFVSILTFDGKADAERACLNPACYQRFEIEGRVKTRDQKAKAVEKGATRVGWHGEYFRNVFFRKRVPAALAALKIDDEKTKTLLFMCLAHASQPAMEALQKALGLRTDHYGGRDKTLRQLLGLPYAKIKPIFPKAIEAAFADGQNVGEWEGFGSTNRRLLAEFLGISLAKEWAADDEYLQKKTKAELLAFGKKSGIFADKKVKEYLEKNFNKKATLEKIKKSELVDVFLKSGINLVGRVPDEILKKARE
jgi:ParB family chromosome partitioning protein